MVCFHPLSAYRAPGGRVVFNPKEGWRDRPVSLACGQCRGCRLERSRQWALRCVHESSLHECNSFITLTYSPQDLPSDGSVNVRDWQLFAKKLRKQCGKFRYFHCGEYGSTTWRPHYHACIFGLDFASDRVLWKDKGDYKLFRSPTLDKVWGKGHTSVGNLTYKSAAYVARYIMKKVTGEHAAEYYRRVNLSTGEETQLKPEYITMSRRPGLGRGWYDKYKTDVYPSDFCVVEGTQLRPPKFYDTILGDEDGGELARMKEKRREAVFLHRDCLTPDKLAIKERAMVNPMNVFERDLE